MIDTLIEQTSSLKSPLQSEFICKDIYLINWFTIKLGGLEFFLYTEKEKRLNKTAFSEGLRTYERKPCLNW